MMNFENIFETLERELASRQMNIDYLRRREKELTQENEKLKKELEEKNELEDKNETTNDKFN